MKKRLASLMLAMALMLAGNAGVTASAVEIRDLKMDCPSTIVVDKTGVFQVDLPFSGLGIDSITVAAGKNVTPKIVNANWQAFPKTCTARVQISVSGNGNFDFIMRNNVKGEIFRKNFQVAVQSSNSSGKTTYIVTHAKGVNVRTTPVNGKVKKALSRNQKFTVTTINNNWGFVPEYSGWVCLDYCQKANTSSSSTSSNSKVNTSKILDFAQRNAFLHANWLCAEYASRACIEGGLNIGVIKGCGTLYRTLDKLSSQCTKYALTVNKNGRIYPTGSNKGKIAPGDPLVIYCQKCKMYQHALLVGDVTNDGVRVYAHNHPHCNDVYSAFQYCSDCGGGHNTVYVFHLK